VKIEGDASMKLDHHVQLRIAVAARVDPSTVRRYLDRKPVRGLSRERVEGALRQMDLTQFLVGEATST
jgi:hypothetical protein